MRQRYLVDARLSEIRDILQEAVAERDDYQVLGGHRRLRIRRKIPSVGGDTTELVLAEVHLTVKETRRGTEVVASAVRRPRRGFVSSAMTGAVSSWSPVAALIRQFMMLPTVVARHAAEHRAMLDLVWRALEPMSISRAGRDPYRGR